MKSDFLKLEHHFSSVIENRLPNKEIRKEKCLLNRETTNTTSPDGENPCNW